MESLYRKLYEKYEMLKKRKLSEMDEINSEQEVKFLNYVSAAEEFIHHLKSENERLHEQVNDLRSEMASVRSAKDEQCAEYQKILMDENRKNKALSEEVERLEKMQQEVLSYSLKDRSNCIIPLSTPQSSQTTTPKVSNSSNQKMTRKRSRQSKSQTKEASVTPECSKLDDAILRESREDLPNSVIIQAEAECCKRFLHVSGGDMNNSIPSFCVFQSLIEYVLGMKLSVVNQTEEICITALHQASGYSFSLTWVTKTNGKDVELLYRVLSLGTFDRVAPEWMREVLMFSSSMCPIFFERVSRVFKLHC